MRFCEEPWAIALRNFNALVTSLVSFLVLYFYFLTQYKINKTKNETSLATENFLMSGCSLDKFLGKSFGVIAQSSFLLDLLDGDRTSAYLDALQFLSLRQGDALCFHRKDLCSAH